MGRAGIIDYGTRWSPGISLTYRGYEKLASKLLSTHSFVRPQQSHSSVPTADFSCRRVERQSRTALLQRRRRLVLDGREHDGMLRWIGAEGDRTTWRTYDNANHVRRIDRVPSSASRALYSEREVQV